MAEEDRRFEGPEEFRLTTGKTQEVLDYVVQELRRVGLALVPGIAVDFVKLRVLNVAPKKPREGMLVQADGTNWNPGGTGAGVYNYRSGAWVKIG